MGKLVSKLLEPFDNLMYLVKTSSQKTDTSNEKILFHENGSISVNYDNPEVQRNIKKQMEILSKKLSKG